MAINDTNLNRTFTVRRKAAKHSEAWYQTTSAPLPPSLQGEGIPARRKPRLDAPLPTATDEADRETTLPEDLAGLLPPTTDTDDANVDIVPDTQPNAVAGRWTPEEDAKLTSAVPANTFGKKHMVDWVALSSLVPGRTASP